MLDNVDHTLKMQLEKAEFEKKKEAPLTVLPRQKLLWNKSGKEFVQTFHKLIENKKISLNGNYDLEPIARVLLDTFDIPKGKGTGFVNEESMLTYFRKENAGDVY